MEKVRMTLLVFLFVIAFPGILIAQGQSEDLSESQRAVLIEQINEGIRNGLQLDSFVERPIIVVPEVKVNNIQEESYDEDTSENVIVILGLIIPFVFFFGIAWLVLWTLKHRFSEKCRIIDKAIDHNYHLPESFYTGRIIADGKSSDGLQNFRGKQRLSPLNVKKMNSALTYIAVGITAIIFFLVIGVRSLAVLSLFPLLLGGAKLLTYFIERNSSCNFPENKEF